ncbi:hypothetical protein, partial [Salmonella sp. s51228]|uniref:hypothetical protein n=1 Tax=Salmonella sp. s51228 TaxID=3159652 RepID=UPI00397F5241
ILEKPTEECSSLSQEDVQTLSEVIDKLDNLKECVEEIKTEMQSTSDPDTATQSADHAIFIPTDTDEKTGMTEKLKKAQTRLTKKVNNLISDLEKQVSNLEPSSLTSDSVCTSDLIDTLLTLKQ